tara:strand:- start:402 stop:629 length:228 start_codon:yes stop_codon:yes gene_type:complete
MEVSRLLGDPFYEARDRLIVRKGRPAFCVADQFARREIGVDGLPADGMDRNGVSATPAFGDRVEAIHGLTQQSAA